MSCRHRWFLGVLFALGGLSLGLVGCGDELAGVQVPQIEVNPTEISFSQVILGDRDVQTVTIRNRGNATLIITQLTIEANTADLKPGFEFTDDVQVEPEQEIRVDVVYEPVEIIQARGDLVIVSNADNERELRVPIVTPPLAPVIDVRPEIIDFGFVAESSVNTIEVTLTNRGSAPLLIDSMEVTGSADFASPDLEALDYPVELDVFVSDDPSRQPTLTFEVTYSPPTPGGDEGAIIIEYNSLSGTNFIVDLTGEAGLPALTVSPNPVDFGARPLGIPARQTVTVTNTGQVSLDLIKIELELDSSRNFTLVNLQSELQTTEGTVRLTPDISMSFLVEYTPPAERTDGGFIRITYETEGDEDFERVAVIGVGVDNRCPIAVARGSIRGDDRYVSQIDWATPTDILILDGSDSSDPDGTIEEYEWTMTRAPAGTTTSLRPVEGLESDDSMRQFFIPLSGRYEFTLHVVDNVGFRDCDDPAVVTVISLPDEAVHIELSWHNPLDPDELDDQGSDVDLHFVKMGFNWFDDRYDNYYANQEPNWGPELPSLDIDDTDGAGPENIQMDNPVDCQWYAVGVHYFEKQFGIAYATIRVYIDTEQIAELVNQPLENTDDFWDVGRLHWPTGEFFAVDQIYENFDSSSARPPSLTPEMVEAVAGGVCQ